LANRESGSNKIDKSDLHHEKHDEPMISTLLGIEIVGSNELQNALGSIRFNCEFCAKEKHRSISQSL
jgi:hypothetical protein